MAYPRLQSPLLRMFAANIATATTYVAAGWLGFQLYLPGNVASPVWPPSGMMLAAVLLYGRRLLPGVAVGAAIFDILNFPAASGVILLDVAGATMEPLIASAIIRTGKCTDFFTDWRGCVRFLGGACAGTGIAASFGVFSFISSGLLLSEDGVWALVTWWAGNFAACLSISPLLIVWFSGRHLAEIAARPSEALLVLCLLPTAGGALFALHLFPSASLAASLELMAVPTLVLAAYRFHTPGATTAVFLLSVAALSTTRWGANEIGFSNALLQLQFFLITSCGLTLLLASERADRLRAFALATEARRVAEDANRAKTAFLANMSHEFRTPLNAVIGFSDMMNCRAFGPLGHPKYEEYASYITRSGSHLLKLISDILDMSKIEAGNVALSREDVTIDDVLIDAAIMIAPQAADAGVAIVTGPQSGITFNVDRRYALQVAINLISNAVKFTPRGGTISLEAVSDGERTGFLVRDTGIGMASEHIPLVLQPFYQVRRSEESHNAGVGLGLPIAKKLVEMHGGRFEIESTPGCGTTVTAVFPVAESVLSEACP